MLSQCASKNTTFLRGALRTNMKNAVHRQIYVFARKKTSLHMHFYFKLRAKSFYAHFDADLRIVRNVPIHVARVLLRFELLIPLLLAKENCFIFCHRQQQTLN